MRIYYSMARRYQELNEDKLGAYYIYNIFGSKLVEEYPGISEFVLYSRALLPSTFLGELSAHFDFDESAGFPNKRRFSGFDSCFDYQKAMTPENVKTFRKILSDFFGKKPRWQNYKGFEEIRGFWNFSDAEMSALLYCVTATILERFTSILNNFSVKSRQRIIMAALNLKASNFHCLFGINSALRKRGVIDENYVCNDDILDFISNGAEGYCENMVSKIEPSISFGLDTFGLKEMELKIVKGLLQSGKRCKILFYGLPGTGKTAFANSLAKELGKPVFSDKKNSNSKSNRMKFLLPCRVAEQQNGIALFDEVDSYIESNVGIFKKSNCDKGEINEILDKAEGKSIWITNSIDGMDESTRRRFTFSIGFKNVSECLKKHSILSALESTNLKPVMYKDISKICEKYSLSPAGISLAIENAAVVANGNEHKILPIIDSFASAYATLRGESDFTKKPKTCSDKFDSKIINADCDIQKLLTTLRSYQNAKLAGDVNSSMNLLFFGVSGTGKSEFAKYIAETLDCPLIVKRMSDILSKFVGEAEQNIASAFSEAEVKNGVLLIDEADSLFSDRNLAQQRYEISQVNEFLSQMDDFRGILICTTNLFESFDSATMRRFQKKIKFSPPTNEGIKSLLEKYFSIDANTANTLDLETLDGICAGDFKNVYEQLRFEGNPTTSEIINTLQRELIFKQKQNTHSIGFCV